MDGTALALPAAMHSRSLFRVMSGVPGASCPRPVDPRQRTRLRQLARRRPSRRLAPRFLNEARAAVRARRRRSPRRRRARATNATGNDDNLVREAQPMSASPVRVFREDVILVLHRSYGRQTPHLASFACGGWSVWLPGLNVADAASYSKRPSPIRRCRRTACCPSP